MVSLKLENKPKYHKKYIKCAPSNTLSLYLPLIKIELYVFLKKTAYNLNPK